MANIFHEDFSDFIKALNNCPGAYKNSNLVEIESISIRLVDYRDLLKAKKATSRSKDINDIENLDEK